MSKIVENVEARTDRLERLGYELKSCWCVDCANIGNCQDCNGLGRKRESSVLNLVPKPIREALFPAKSPVGYAKIDGLVIEWDQPICEAV